MAEPLTITDAAPLIKSGELMPSELLEQCLRRVDVYEPAVKAWVFLDRERARQDAQHFTDELKRGQHRGPLHGIPVGVKDIIDVFDMPTGCGSKLWANSYARRDATCVERLRQAGAVIVGKTVTTPFAYLDPPVTRNPWNLDRTPGGSSSGSAAAVACGMVLAALGTQTGGSLTRPASYCGVCSLKPTWGTISVDGVLPLAPSLDHVGVIANCVRDLAVVLEAVSGPGGRRGYNIKSRIVSVVAAFDAGEEGTPPFDLLTGTFESLITPAARLSFDRLFERLDDALFDMDRVVTPAGFVDLPSAHFDILATEAAEFHGDRFGRRPEEYPARVRELVETGLCLPAVRYRQALELQRELREQFRDMCDGPRMYLTPATTDFPPDPSTTGNAIFNLPWSFVEAPTISVPAGRSDDGLPFAVQLSGRPNYEDELVQAAAWIENELAFSRGLPPVPA